jgi:NAD(P)-dependent dehydrogenase (short-subunit alcohol dehydrogenase family)
LRQNQISKDESVVRGKTVVITGGTSGIGEVAAVTLARMGARIVLIARDKTRADATLARLRDSVPGIAHSVHLADLLRLAEMKRVAAQIADHEPRIDVLIVRLQMLWDNLAVFGTEALARLGLRLGGFQLVLQSSQFDGVAFDPFSFQKDGSASAEVDVGRCQVL